MFLPCMSNMLKTFNILLTSSRRCFFAVPFFIGFLVCLSLVLVCSLQPSVVKVLTSLFYCF